MVELMGSGKALLQTAALVGLSEFGDKTQLVVLLLAIQLKSPWRVFFGVSLGAILIHLISVTLGHWIYSYFQSDVFKYVLALGFLVMGFFLAFSAWKDQAQGLQDICDEVKTPFRSWRKFPFWTSALVFFTAELGDKTQMASLAMSAHLQQPWMVLAGAVFALSLLNGLIILGGEKILGRIPVVYLKGLSAVLFMLLGVWILVS